MDLIKGEIMNDETREYVKLRREGNVAILTMNAPERRNAYSLEMKQSLLAHVSALSEDKNCRAIVLTGEGGHFSAGGDISQMRRREVVEMRMSLGTSHALVRLLSAGPKPFVAAVEGYAYGAGLSLACAADYVVAATDAKFCAAFIRVGLVPDVGLRWTLSQRVGTAKAKELIMLASELNADEAARLGVANQVVESGKALGIAIDVAERLAKRSPTALALVKATFARGCESLESALQMELDYQPLLKNTDEHLEAIKAFLEKRGGRK